VTCDRTPERRELGAEIVDVDDRLGERPRHPSRGKVAGALDRLGDRLGFPGPELDASRLNALKAFRAHRDLGRELEQVAARVGAGGAQAAAELLERELERGRLGRSERGHGGTSLSRLYTSQRSECSPDRQGTSRFRSRIGQESSVDRP
jgi:hypothetical protein